MLNLRISGVVSRRLPSLAAGTVLTIGAIAVEKPGWEDRSMPRA